jgi:murein DD-endopeptidase MepM/ murein hydrolase activator NlpD
MAVMCAMSTGQGVLASDAPMPLAETPQAGSLVAVTDVQLTAATDPAPSPDAQTPAARITFGRAVDVEGRTMFGHRKAFAATASVVTFSAERPRASTESAGGPAGLRASGPLGPLPRFLPVSARLMTSGFGTRVHPILGVQRNHLGVDLAVPNGTPIAATAEGVVSYAGWDGGYGLLVAVDHRAGIQTRYAHMSRIAVTTGQRVKTGDVLGFVGSTGLSTGPHVHYEVRVNGQAVSPFQR